MALVFEQNENAQIQDICVRLYNGTVYIQIYIPCIDKHLCVRVCAHMRVVFCVSVEIDVHTLYPCTQIQASIRW